MQQQQVQMHVESLQSRHLLQMQQQQQQYQQQQQQYLQQQQQQQQQYYMHREQPPMWKPPALKTVKWADGYELTPLALTVPNTSPGPGPESDDSDDGSIRLDCRQGRYPIRVAGQGRSGGRETRNATAVAVATLGEGWMEHFTAAARR